MSGQEPAWKEPAMEASLDQMSQQMFGRTRTDCIRGGQCVMCGGPAEEFRDELSRQENAISGMCQKCQDEVFDEL